MKIVTAKAALGINWHPIRIGMRRVRGVNTWWIDRGGEPLGEIEYKNGRWHSWKGYMSEVYEKGRTLVYLERRNYKNPMSSFRTAVLKLVRAEVDCRGPRDLGTPRVLSLYMDEKGVLHEERRGASFLVLLTKDGPEFYKATSAFPSGLMGSSKGVIDASFKNDGEQAFARKAIAAVEQWKKENL